MTTADLQTRALTLEDAPAMTDIYAAVEVAEPEDDHFSVDDIREELQRPNVDLARGSVAIVDGDRLLGFGVFEPRFEGDHWQGYLDGAVHPEFRRQGIGRRVMAELLIKARRWRDEIDQHRSVDVKLWIGQARVAGTAFAAERGFEPTRWFFRMKHPLGDPVTATAPAAGYRIRPYEAADSEATRLASNDSFADHWGSVPMDERTWHGLITGTRSFRPDLSLVAVDGQDHVVGFALQAEYAAETAERGYATGWVDRLGVVRQARGNGIATALLTGALATVQGQGFRAAELSVDADSPTGANRIYERVGFEAVSRTTTFVRVLPPASR
ncbi:GNAT family N-acetyltransferase [Nakamurella silvestris]|nr:GNAT family N-acetyltransferase [Nakamurella silvestris]